MFQERKFENNIVGFEARKGNALFFFGTRFATTENLPKIFPNLRFAYLSQVHGNKVVTADPEMTLEADGHRTQETNLALVIQTADCLPVLASSADEVVAMHAGWRGLASKIIDEGLKSSKFEDAAVGPHIRAQSFEVGLDVADQLREFGEAPILPHPDLQKRYVDLSAIASKQLKAHRVIPEILSHDTFTSPLFYSYRKGKEKAQRQYSFVALLES
jgi:polyphenol oxidase